MRNEDYDYNLKKQTDYLDEWRDFMKLQKWKLAEINNPKFKAVDWICETLRGFYSPDDFSKEKINPDNWIVHVLANKQQNSLMILGEHCVLLDMYNSDPDFRSLNLKTSHGKTNHRELNEKMFELYVNRIFRNVGESPQIDRHYEEYPGNIKPIDIALLTDGNLIIVEVTKFYDSFKEEILEAVKYVTQAITQISKKKQIKPEELFSGYILVKSRKVPPIKKTKALIESLIKEHIENFRNPTNQIIKSAAKISNDHFDLLIEPTYLEQFDRYGAKSTGYPGIITFKLSLNHRTGLVKADAKLEVSSADDSQNEYLIEKIKEKIEQHKSFRGEKVIVIGIDHVFTTHKKGSAAAIMKDQVNLPVIGSQLPEDILVLLVFRDILPNKIEYSHLIVGSSNHSAKTILNKFQNKDLYIF